MSATELARRIRDGEFTSRQVVDAHIARAEAVNPTINALVADRFTAARTEADAADAAVAAVRAGNADATTLGPLHGVPCTIKEAFALDGMPNTAGLVARTGIRSDGDAPTVARLRAAGAIPLGVTNTSELCMWMESANRVYGRSRNPYDPSRIVGGSSGGEGAIIGAGASPFGLGSDVGGSIRMPAFFCGVYGHKPTGGLVTNDGQFPAATGNDGDRYLTTGPLARRADDLWPLLEILAGTPLGPGPDEIDIADLFVVVPEGEPFGRTSADLRTAQAWAIEAMRAAGASIRHVDLSGFRHSFEIWSAMLREGEEESFNEQLANGGTPITLRHLAQWTTGRSPHTLPGLILALIEDLPAMTPGHSAKMCRLGATLRAQVVDVLGDNGVLFAPSYPMPAPRHGRPLLTPFDFARVGVFNVLELPVTQVPLGRNGRGLPLGIQVAAPHHADARAIATGRFLETAFGGWQPPAGMRHDLATRRPAARTITEGAHL